MTTDTAETLQVGVLALQGAFAEHAAIVTRLGCACRLVRTADDLAGLDGLILPGGESTAMHTLASAGRLVPALRQFVRGGRPVWGTCAGAILLADTVASQPCIIGGLPATLVRNAYGPQAGSFVEALSLHNMGGSSREFRGIFIRAPRVLGVHEDAQVLARDRAGRPVAVQHRNVVATTFHPELTGDTRFHEHFLSLMHKK